jgi:hypothetical protein
MTDETTPNPPEKPEAGILRLPVANIYNEDVEVAVPDVCPKCGADLRAEGALLHWEYQDQERRATCEDGLDLDWVDELPTSGDAFIPLSWQCSHCRCTLAEGADNPPAARALRCVEEIRRACFPEATEENPDPQLSGGDFIETVSCLLDEHGFDPDWPTAIYADQEPSREE